MCYIWYTHKFWLLQVCTSKHWGLSGICFKFKFTPFLWFKMPMINWPFHLLRSQLIVNTITRGKMISRIFIGWCKPPHVTCHMTYSLRSLWRILLKDSGFLDFLSVFRWKQLCRKQGLQNSFVLLQDILEHTLATCESMH